MVLQDKYKAKASRAWKASRGLSTSAKPSNRKPQPPQVDSQKVFPTLQGENNDKELEDKDANEAETIESDQLSCEDDSIQSNLRDLKEERTYVNSDPKFSKRKIYNNAVRYEIPTDENDQDKDDVNNYENDLSEFVSKSVNINDFERYKPSKHLENFDDDDVDHELANLHRQKQTKMFQIDTSSAKALEDMHKDRTKAENSWNLKSRLRGDSGRQYIQRYESSKKDIDQLNDEGFFASIEKLETPLVDDETKNSNTHDKKSQPAILSKDDQDFLDELI